MLSVCGTASDLFCSQLYWPLVSLCCLFLRRSLTPASLCRLLLTRSIARAVAVAVAIAVLVVLLSVLLIVAVVVATLRHVDLVEDHAEEADAGTVELLLRALEHAAGGHLGLSDECCAVGVLREDRGVDDGADRCGVEDHDVVVLFLDKLEEAVAHLVLEELGRVR